MSSRVAGSILFEEEEPVALPFDFLLSGASLFYHS
jgi:hypothetical protein